MLLDDREEFKGYAAWLFGARLPFFDGGFARVEVSSEDWLAYMLALTNLLDLAWFHWSGNSQTGFVELTHGGLVYGTHAKHGRS